MSEPVVHEADPSDESALREWWEIGALASAERPDFWPIWEVARARLTAPRHDIREVRLVASEDGRPVGSAVATFFLPDNTHLAQVQVYVAPDERRRGVGRRLLAEVEDRARGAGRTTAVATVHRGTGGASAGEQFAAAMAWEVANEETVREVDLAAAQPIWDALQDEVDDALGDYRLRLVERQVPEALLEDYCALLTAFLTQVPLGELDVEPAAWTPERVRANERRLLDLQTTWISAVAIAPDGHLCGFSDLSVPAQDPRRASVGGTLVLPGHRGHRLGLGMKLLTHRRLLEHFPRCARVETDTADVNAPMNAVNERMGYRTVERSLEVQKAL